jgi:hypothetical protein
MPDLFDRRTFSQRGWFRNPPEVQAQGLAYGAAHRYRYEAPCLLSAPAASNRGRRGRSGPYGTVGIITRAALSGRGPAGRFGGRPTRGGSRSSRIAISLSCVGTPLAASFRSRAALSIRSCCSRLQRSISADTARARRSSNTRPRRDTRVLPETHRWSVRRWQPSAAAARRRQSSPNSALRITSSGMSNMGQSPSESDWSGSILPCGMSLRWGVVANVKKDLFILASL